MATTNTITTTYSGESTREFISAALLSSPTIYNGNISVLPNIKYQQVVRKFDTDGLLKDATCDFTDTSTLTTLERILTPKSLQVNLQLCKEDYRDTWDAISMGYSAFDNIPPDFASYLVSYAAAKVAAANETSIWAGATGTSGQFDGFETLLTTNAAQPQAMEIAGTTLSKSNIIAQMELIEDQITAQLYGKDDLAIYIGTAGIKFYIQAQAALGYMDKFHVGQSSLDFHGIPFIHAPGMTANKAICTTKDNLWFGTGLLNDSNEVKVIDMADIDGSQNVRVVMRMTAGAQFGNGEDIVTYGISNGSN